MSIREKGIMGELIKYCNKRGLFEFTWTDIGICTHPYILNNTKDGDIYKISINKNDYININGIEVIE